MKPKPPCPVCGDADRVKIKCGTSCGKYRYFCLNHDETVTWTEAPPDRRTGARQVSMGVTSRRKGYRCKLCGEPKKGHVCLARRAT